MEKFLKNMKKGEITSSTLVSIILVALGAVIIFYFVYQLNFSGMVDRETCHQDVVLRGTIPESASTQELKRTISLRCLTRNACVTTNSLLKGDCEKALGTKFDNIRVSSDKTKNPDEIRQFLSREFAECWSMMGEGKLQIFDRDILRKKSACVICTIVDFDKTTTDMTPKLNGLANYMMTHKVPTREISYWEYLARVRGDLGVNIFTIDNNELSNADLMDLTKPKAIVFIEGDPSYIGGFFGAGTGTAAGIGAIAFFVPGVGPLAGLGIVTIGAVSGALTGNEIHKTLPGQEIVSGIALVDYVSDSESIKNLGCTSFESIPR